MIGLVIRLGMPNVKDDKQWTSWSHVNTLCDITARTPHGMAGWNDPVTALLASHGFQGFPNQFLTDPPTCV